MTSSQHTMADLFAQLGLANSPESINRFIVAHQRTTDCNPLSESGLWTPGQASFLREELAADGDWAEVIDTLNAALLG